MTLAPPRKLIFDTDPGGDDSFALLWLLSLVRQGMAELVAVTATAGNVGAAQTFRNASQVLGLAGFGAVPLGLGMAAPFPGENASHIHGSDGLGQLSATLPPPVHRLEQAPLAADLIVEHLTAAPGQVTLVAVGPLTNLAAAEAQHPGVLQLAQEIVVMGGACSGGGNVTAAAEFNLWFNPGAAQTVLRCRPDLVLLPLEVTRQLVFTPAMAAAAMQGHETHPLAQFALALCQFMARTARQYREADGGFLVHDAATLAYLFYPPTLLLQRAALTIETEGRHSQGQTLIDRRLHPQPQALTWVAQQVDGPRLLACLRQDLRTLVSQGA